MVGVQRPSRGLTFRGRHVEITSVAPLPAGLVKAAAKSQQLKMSQQNWFIPGSFVLLFNNLEPFRKTCRITKDADTYVNSSFYTEQIQRNVNKILFLIATVSK